MTALEKRQQKSFAEADKFIEDNGKIGYNRYGNDILEIADLHEGNVLMGEDGNFYFIDTIPYMKQNHTNQ
ncbi:hypothetical protein [Candidatus Symbiothrix dinenymphae]|uniref:putative polyvalent protein kinase domain-containing protein n=1 Tax=Candidatus Symbiothrix dinenymphae TaxID=467085 RepID=UPI0006E2AEBC|nr:hypothetical protein [Candidatus Symbiothrix dinenymphae]